MHAGLDGQRVVAEAEGLQRRLEAQRLAQVVRHREEAMRRKSLQAAQRQIPELHQRQVEVRLEEVILQGTM